MACEGSRLPCRRLIAHLRLLLRQLACSGSSVVLCASFFGQRTAARGSDSTEDQHLHACCCRRLSCRSLCKLRVPRACHASVQCICPYIQLELGCAWHRRGAHVAVAPDNPNTPDVPHAVVIWGQMCITKHCYRGARDRGNAKVL